MCLAGQIKLRAVVVLPWWYVVPQAWWRWTKVQNSCLLNFKIQPIILTNSSTCRSHLTFVSLFIFYLFFEVLFFYSWKTHRERGRDTGRGRSRLLAGNLMWDSIPDPGITPWAKGRRSTTERRLGSSVVECLPLARCDPRVWGSNPTSSFLHGACFSLCLCLCLSLCVSFMINK